MTSFLVKITLSVTAFGDPCGPDQLRDVVKINVPAASCRYPLTRCQGYVTVTSDRISEKIHIEKMYSGDH